MTLGRLQIIEPLAVSAIGTTSAHPTQVNLLTNDPKEIWAPGAASGQDIVLDLGSAQNVDSVFLGFTNAATDVKASVSSVTSMAGAGPVTRVASTTIRAADAKTVRSSVLLKAAAPFSSRYVLLHVDANGANWQVGRVAVGLAFEASWDREWGAGRRVIDTGKVQALLSGGFGVQPGARKAAYSWTFGDLTDAEVEQLFGIALRVGQSSPLIVNEQDGAAVGANDKLHYGLLQRLDAWDRRDPNATKWAFEIEQWI